MIIKSTIDDVNPPARLSVWKIKRVYHKYFPYMYSQ